MALRGRFEMGCVQHGELRLERGEPVGIQAKEHVVGEQRVPRAFADDPNVETVLGVRPRTGVPDEQVTRLQIGDHVLAERGVVIR